MASIAYVCQHEMIEFHRLRGHQEIVFLRLSTKQFSRFDTNDYLFFLTRSFHRSERGIVGYGKLHKQEQASPKTMWQRHKDMTGYPNIQEMYEALDKMAKGNQKHKKISGLHLKEVVYFEFPVYLSEFGYDLEPNLESFTYIDQEQDITSKLLSAVKSIGLDLWSQTQNSGMTIEDLDLEIKRHVLAHTASKYGLFTENFNRTLNNRLLRFSDKLQKIPETNQAYTLIVDGNLICYLPLLQRNSTAINELIGISCTLSRAADQHPLIENPKFKVIVYGNGNLKKNFVEQLELFNIQYLDVKKE